MTRREPQDLRSREYLIRSLDEARAEVERLRAECNAALDRAAEAEAEVERLRAD